MLTRRPWIALVAALVVETIVFVCGQRDFVPADPLWYATNANQLAVDPHSLFALHDSHPFVMRLGLTVPLSLLYRVFGVSAFVSNLPVLFAAFGLTAVIYAAMPTPRAKLLGALACVVSVPLLQQATMLNVDLPVAALVGLTVLCLRRRWMVAAVLAWFAAFMVKEVALWCAPIWLYVLVVDLRERGWRAVARAYAPALGVGLAILVAYLALCQHLWGDPLARFKGISAAVGSVGESQSYGAAWNLRPSRMLWDVPVMLFKMFGALLVPLVASPWLVRGRDQIWPVATALIILAFWFGSSTMSAYVPLPISQRLILPVLPLVLVTAILACEAALERFAPSPLRLGVSIALALAVAVPGVRTIIGVTSHGRPETEAFATLRGDVAAHGSQPIVLVCGEPRCPAIAVFHFKFAAPPNVSIVSASDFAHAPKPDHALVRALVNLPRGAGVRRSDPHADYTGTIDKLGLPALYRSKDVRLYDAGDGATLWQTLQASP